jgi:undecaprenyl diphosphate synthase
MNSIKNVAIIMDGNGRWAKQRLRPRVWGHVRGSQKVREIVTSASELGLESLTLYAFSTENWSRPTDEVTSLFKLLKKLLLNEKKTILKQNIQFNVIGNYKVLDTEVVLLIEELRELSRHNTGLKFSLAINYGGRSEIVDSVNKFLKKSNIREITEEDISNNLYNPNLGEIDLLIRTSGDQRVSNFLLWQICYSEFFFTKTKWPDFSKKEFEEIISSVSERERRFGGTSGDATLTSNKRQANSNLKIMS